MGLSIIRNEMEHYIWLDCNDAHSGVGFTDAYMRHHAWMA